MFSVPWQCAIAGQLLEACRCVRTAPWQDNCQQPAAALLAPAHSLATLLYMLLLLLLLR
jgi:hypothetical protein